MFAVLAIISFAAGFFEHWDKVSISPPFDQPGLLFIGLVFLAIHSLRVHGVWGNWRNG